MANITAKRIYRTKRFTEIELPATAASYFKGGILAWDTSTGLVTKIGVSTTQFPIGRVAEEQVGAVANTVTVGSGGTIIVELFRELMCVWMVNAGGGDAVVAANLGGLAYCLDDQTVANNDATNTRAVFGRIWALDTTLGVLVEPIQTAGDRHLTELDA